MVCCIITNLIVYVLKMTVNRFKRFKKMIKKLFKSNKSNANTHAGRKKIHINLLNKKYVFDQKGSVAKF